VKRGSVAAGLAACWALAIVCHTNPVAPQESSTTTYESETLPGKPVSQLPPLYPPTAMRRGLTGRVCLAYSVDARGRVENIAILESAGPILDARAEKALSDYQFDVPSDWVASGGPAKRYRMGFIFELSSMPKVPRFEYPVKTVVISASEQPEGLAKAVAELLPQQQAKCATIGKVAVVEHIKGSILIKCVSADDPEYKVQQSANRPQ
jgi:TonB family protein